MSRESYVEIVYLRGVCCWNSFLADWLFADAQETFGAEKKEEKAEEKAVPAKFATAPTSEVRGRRCKATVL